ncbi:MAG: hypothetical protein ABI634_02935 [Acidobacteriota bacterium]
MAPLSSSGARIREAVESADRARRTREAWTWAKKAAPLVAAVSAAACLTARAAGAPTTWALVTLLAPAAALISIIAVVYRPRPASDVTAARSDVDAGLRGELRSAHWFAAQESVDEWTAWHMDRAASTAADVAWNAVYPKPKLRRALAFSIVLLVAAVAIPLRGSAVVPAPAGPRAGAVSLDELALTNASPELQQLVLDAAAAVLARRMSASEALKGLEQSADWRALDPSVRRRVDEALRRIALDDQTATGRPAPDPPGATAEQAEWAREELAARLATEQAQKKTEPEAPKNSERESKEQAGATEESSDGQGGEGSKFKSNQVQREVPDGKGDPSAAMIDPSGPASGEAGTGFGGKHGDPTYRRAQQAAIEAAFKRELVEASTNVGSNERTNDRRRQTEQSASSLDHARTPGRSIYDRANVDTTATVPEARLPWLERYFSRTEQR